MPFVSRQEITGSSRIQTPAPHDNGQLDAALGFPQELNSSLGIHPGDLLNQAP